MDVTKLVACDISTVALDEAKERWEKDGPPRVNLSPAIWGTRRWPRRSRARSGSGSPGRTWRRATSPLHYACGSPERIDALLDCNATNVKKGGVVVATIIDWLQLRQMFTNGGRIGDLCVRSSARMKVGRSCCNCRTSRARATAPGASSTSSRWATRSRTARSSWSTDRPSSPRGRERFKMHARGALRLLLGWGTTAAGPGLPRPRDERRRAAEACVDDVLSDEQFAVASPKSTASARFRG